MRSKVQLTRYLAIVLLLLLPAAWAEAAKKYKVTIPGIGTVEVTVEEVTMPDPEPEPEPEPIPEPIPTTVFLVPQNGPLDIACKAIKSGGRIVIQGEVKVTTPAMIGLRTGAGANNVTIEGDPSDGPDTLVDNCGSATAAFITVGSSGNTIRDLELVGNFGPRRCIRGYENSHSLTISRCKFSDFARHCIDIDGNDFTVEDCDIQRILYHDPVRGRLDAHGIVTTRSQVGVIRRCQVGQCSGDSWQGEDGPWNLITIEDCDFWDSPLAKDAGGFKAGERVSENGIDTKSSFTSRNTLHVLRTTFSGFGAGKNDETQALIKNAAALNLKQNIDVYVEGCSISDCEIGFRVRGHHDGEVLRALLVNNRVSGCRFAVRGEDKPLHLRMQGNIYTDCTTYFLKATTTQPWTYEGWDVADNTIIDAALVGKTWNVWPHDKGVLGEQPMDFPVPPVKWVDGVLARTTNKIVGAE